MKKYQEAITGTLGVLIYTILGLLVLSTPYGIYHAFTKHGNGTGFATLFIPPYAWYMTLESLWHDDFQGVDWGLRLKNDVKLTAVLLAKSAAIMDASQTQQHGDAVEEYANKIKEYPEEKRAYLDKFAVKFIQYHAMLLSDIIKSIDNTATNLMPFRIIPDMYTLELERELVGYPGAKDFVEQYRIGLYSLTQRIGEMDVQNLTVREKDRLLNLLGTLRLSMDNQMDSMKEVYFDIFGRVYDAQRSRHTEN